MADTKPLHQTRFEAAVSVIQSLPKNGSFQPSNEMMLKFYSFYKQATLGPCNTARPGFWDPVGRYKWDAWNSLGDMSKEDAMIAYVDEMKKIIETMPVTDKVEELLQVIGPFYEIVEDKKHGRGSGVTSELGSVLTSTPNGKAVNGKAESSDSGAESDEEQAAAKEFKKEDEEDEEDETEHSEEEEKEVEQQPGHETSAESIVLNGLTKNSRVLITEEPTPLPTKCLSEPGDNVAIPEGEPDIQSAVINDSEADREEDCTEDMAAVQHLTSDSDSEIFCDSMEQFGQDEADHSLLLQDAMLNGDITENSAGGELKDGGEDGKQPGHGAQGKTWNGKSEHFSSRRERSLRMQPGGEGSRSGQIGSSGDGDGWGSDRGPIGNLNEQIAVVLMRLQEDMQNVLQRLHSLEVQTASQAQSLLRESNTQSVEKKPSGWPFGISPGTLALAVVWPFVVHWLMHVFLQKRRRKQT
ncbi:acyl-CoA-binding domain-containing protein 5 [Xenopus laevis]|uniref:Acyl-CoA-binding domain-containing protein 5 n=1 Tax=Xenopus laevis TaxID=8355 RepID=ACBD5_XENLA|nr:acyl-CoA-binding domain-containing protein 5 [Xenopus laevis]Q641E3.1 RecName: Full=Acyl-CoA-binding domain-containing protein 5 [Xenopus laevis]AAH82394.1 MGC81871 protein [Xenopus laevis]